MGVARIFDWGGPMYDVVEIVQISIRLMCSACSGVFSISERGAITSNFPEAVLWKKYLGGLAPHHLGGNNG